jgi:hypothetical protein
MDASKVECHSDYNVSSPLPTCKPEVITAEPGDEQVPEPIISLQSKVMVTALISLCSFRNIYFFYNFLVCKQFTVFTALFLFNSG